MQKYKNLMPYIHLPIQSGSSKILEKMGRKTNLKQYIKLIKYARKNIPNLVVSTDFIVGFPNET
jgi:tRNA-2-methylthio-N6-dimethylallyladenosine synthase